MSLGFGRHYLAIPGPSVMPDRVLNAMHVPAPNIYHGELVDTVAEIVTDLKAVAKTEQNVAIYIANGHGVWEAANANVFSRGDRVLSLATGRFGVNWAAQAREMGVNVEMIDFGLRSPVDPQRVEEALRADTGHAYKAVLLTHVDTATSVLNDVLAVRQAMDAAGHPALLMVDCVASLACDPFEMDAWGVDVLVTASQKGLMTPPGLGMVYFSDRARAETKGNDLRTPYWNWEPRCAPQEFYQHFYGTAPTHLLLGLGAALDMILRGEGLDMVLKRHEILAKTVWAAFDAWGVGTDIRLNIEDPARRGHSVTAARIGAPNATALREWTEKKAGVTLGIGLGMAEPTDPAWHGFLRVAHMGHVNAHMTLGVLSVMEAGMQALSIPHGPGALEAAAAVIAANA